MARHAQRYLDMLVPDPADGSITERARRSLYLLLPAGRATLEQVGDNLGLHPRALQRLLDKEGRTFATLLNEVRRELALRYLVELGPQRDRDRADDRLCHAQARSPAGSPPSSGWRRPPGAPRSGRSAAAEPAPGCADSGAASPGKRRRGARGGEAVLPQVRAAALTNYVEVARFVGLDPDGCSARADQPGGLADPEH